MSAYSPVPITVCDRCGAELPPGVRYCANCGQEVGSTSEFASQFAPPVVDVDPYRYPGTEESGRRIRKLVSSGGRIGRLEWVLTILGIWLFLIVTWSIVIGVDAPGVTIVLGFASLILSAVVATCAGVKRLHDFDKSGWMYLLILVPVIGFLLLLALLVVGPSSGPNRFGGEESGSVIR